MRSKDRGPAYNSTRDRVLDTRFLQASGSDKGPGHVVDPSDISYLHDESTLAAVILEVTL